MKNKILIAFAIICSKNVIAQIQYALIPNQSMTIQCVSVNSTKMDMQGKKADIISKQYYKLQFVKTDEVGNNYFTAVVDSFNYKMTEGTKTEDVNSNDKSIEKKRNFITKNLGVVGEYVPLKISKLGRLTFLENAPEEPSFLKDLFIEFPSENIKLMDTWTINDTIKTQEQSAPLSKLENETPLSVQTNKYTITAISDTEITIECEQKSEDMMGEALVVPMHYVVDRKTGFVKSIASQLQTSGFMKMDIIINVSAKW